MSNNNQKITVLADICDWCGKPIPLSSESKNLVCSHCYRLLIGAGLSDARIFEKDAD